MTDIIISISLYLIAAILLGFTFGWFIAKAISKENQDEKVEVLSINYDENMRRIGVQNEEQQRKFDDLMMKFSTQQDELIGLKSKHTQEVNGFLEERIDITNKYKELLLKVKS